MLENIFKLNMWRMMYLLPLGNSDRFLAVDEDRRPFTSSWLSVGWPMAVIRVISVWKSLAIVWFAVSFSAGNRLIYHLSA